MQRKTLNDYIFLDRMNRMDRIVNWLPHIPMLA